MFYTDEKLIDLSLTTNSNYFAVFDKIPNLIFNIREFPIPSVSNILGSSPYPNDSSSLPFSGVSNAYNPLSVKFILDEQFITYFTLYQWMLNNEKTDLFNEMIGQMTIVILNNSKRPIIRLDFEHVLPETLDQITFINQSADDIEFTCTFKYFMHKYTYLTDVDISSYIN